ncbi:hypothetical protein DPMN_013177 [Dreissena polymorpha]|uniref:Uncharacterized protein n=1 Tax=Dreissena polymorpha TaxID=45954 RepID=A0A9D4S424_DREPO|nr:hypothetical protein DPMN_013177 [Dreissena polymorpha]
MLSSVQKLGNVIVCKNLLLLECNIAGMLGVDSSVTPPETRYDVKSWTCLEKCPIHFAEFR